MVFVKVRETYDLQTVQNKMTVIGIHTPKPDIIKRNYPGLLMQCRAYRPVSADVKVACASVLPLDPKGIGLTEDDVAPEDIFNPILYKAMSNKGMSQLEARINNFAHVSTNLDVDGDSAAVDVDSVTPAANEFNIYYSLLSNTREWKHANPQSGLSMTKLKPYVYERVYNVGDTNTDGGSNFLADYVDGNGYKTVHAPMGILGKAKPFPYLNCTGYTYASTKSTGWQYSGFTGFTGDSSSANSEQDVPWLNVYCGCIIIPPSRLHQLFYRMVIEWTIEFTSIRPLVEIMSFVDLNTNGGYTHYQNYSYESTKEAVTGSEETMLESDSCMVSSNVDINKVM